MSGEDIYFRGDRDFIMRAEGGIRASGYVPQRQGRPVGESGVTIGAGVDLGHQTEEGLRACGVDEALLESLKPYLGLRKEAALRALTDRPLELSMPEARELTGLVHDGIIGALARCYERETGHSFYSLPSAWQTVIADLAIQYGPALAKRTPRFWGHVTGGRWGAARAELEDFKDAFESRRLSEVALLRRHNSTVLA
jgi:hypothetical protein